MKTKIALVLCSFFLLAGCQMPSSHRDTNPPSAPKGIYTATGDNLVEIVWFSNPEPDVAGYNVFVSTSYFGRYDLIGSTGSTQFIDYGARNGQTYFYAVSAFDFAGNESDLSKDIAYDTPRPEGYSVVLNDYRVRPNLAGYDFSTYSVGQYNDDFTDIFFEYYNGTYYMDVWEDTDIQDMGYTNSLYDIAEAPEGGWSPTKDARLILGHTYVVWTWDDHYAKFRVTSLSSSRVVFDWAYQLQKGNIRLKTSPHERKPLELGAGAKERQEQLSVEK